MLDSFVHSSHSLPLRWAFSATAIAALTACGGGGGGGTNAVVPAAAPTTAATTQFPLTSAIANYVNQNIATPLRFVVTGNATSNGQQIGTITGSGTTTVAKSTSTFEGGATLRRNQLKTGSATLVVTASGASTTIPLITSDNEHFDTNYVPVGTSATGRYCVVSSKSILPSLVRVGDSGDWFSLSCFTSSTKSVRDGGATFGYRVVALDPNNAILKLTYIQTTTANNPVSGSHDFKMSTTGAIEHYEHQSSLSQDGITITIVEKY
jgi:hypothetical protein